MEQQEQIEQHKKMITENWKWALFHNEVAVPFYKKVSFAAAAVLAVALGILMYRDPVSFDFSKKQDSKAVSQAEYSSDVLRFFSVQIAPVSMTKEEFAEKYYADTDLQKLEESIVSDLNSTGKISVDHMEITPAEYAQNAQNPAFIQTNITPDILVFTAIIYSPNTNQIDRFIAVARKLDKWRLAVVNTPGTSKHQQSFASLKDTSEKIYSAIKK